MTRIIAVLLVLGQFEVAVETSKGYFVATYPDTEIGVAQFLRAIRPALGAEPGRFYMLASAATALADREADRAQSLTIESDKIDRIDKDRLLIFMGNVVAAQQRDWRLYADRMEVYLDETGNRVLKVTSIDPRHRGPARAGGEVRGRVDGVRDLHRHGRGRVVGDNECAARRGPQP